MYSVPKKSQDQKDQKQTLTLGESLTKNTMVSIESNNETNKWIQTYYSLEPKQKEITEINRK